MVRRRRWRVVMTVTLLGAGIVGPLAAQRAFEPTRWELGIDLAGLIPVGEFQQFIDAGGGLDLSLLRYFDQGRHIGLRFDGGFALYGHERFQVPLLPTTGRILVDVTTDNMIFGLGLGPQVTLLRGRFRPYAYGTAGFGYFATISSVSGSATLEDFASTTNFDDWTTQLSLGGGFTWRVSSGRHPIALGASTRYVYNGSVVYLNEGGLVDNPDGSATLYPIRSNANYVVIRLGLTVGF
ncbi:MAG TPA: hypothetical protein VGA22_09090 [Gemmatimonadales bacterium]